jgi:hypothetical protein
MSNDVKDGGPALVTDVEACCDGAPVRVFYDADFYVMNGERVGVPMNKRNYIYKCEACGKKLSVTRADAMLSARGSHD